MGLIGYINDEMQRRSKEIAIRKVNGAEASSILLFAFERYILDFNACGVYRNIGGLVFGSFVDGPVF